MHALHHPDSQGGPPALRFAPSPNGYLHLGHALSALENQRIAQRLGGKVLLRMEDIDLTRCRPDFDTAIREDLTWIGFAWDGEVRRQSEHFPDYVAALERLSAMGLTYEDHESRAELKARVAAHEAETGAAFPRDPDGAPLVRRGDQNGGSDPRAAIRLDLEKALQVLAGPLFFTSFDDAGHSGEPVLARPELWGDVVLARKETPTSYHLSVVVDDALQGVTHVVRGADLTAAVHIHVALQRLLGLRTPLYHHHRLILGPDGRKLSKSEAATGLRSLRAAGATPADIRAMIYG